MDIDTIKLDADTEARQEWHCTAPPKGSVFRVVREEWDTDSTPMVRRIYDWMPA